MAKKVSLRRRATGAAALGLIGLGLWLGSKFGGFGLGGSGIGFGPGAGDGSGEKGSGSVANDGKLDPDSNPTVGLTGLSRPLGDSAAPAPERLRVIIDGSQLLIADSDEGSSGQPVDATEIAQRAKHVTGDDQGIRVRIERTKRATAGAKDELSEALDAAGIKKEAIQEMSGFLD